MIDGKCYSLQYYAIGYEGPNIVYFAIKLKYLHNLRLVYKEQHFDSVNHLCHLITT